MASNDRIVKITHYHKRAMASQKARKEIAKSQKSTLCVSAFFFAVFA